MATVEALYRVIDAFAPFDTQADWDNAGILAGSGSREVRRVLVALDCTLEAIDRAKALDCELIVTHHPILFHARKNLCEDDPEGKMLAHLVRSNIALIAAHTNFDIAPGGVNDTLAQALDLTDISALDEGLRVGGANESAHALRARAEKTLGDVVRFYGADRTVRRVAVCGGAGGAFWRIAWRAGADAYLTGEIRHSDALDARAAGLVVFEAGHGATEGISVKALGNGLQNGADALQYNVCVMDALGHTFGRE